MAELWDPNLVPGHQENPFVVDDEEDVIQIHDEEEVEWEVAEVIDLTDEFEAHTERREGRSRSEQGLHQFFLPNQGFHLRPGMTVELKEPKLVEKFPISFVRLTSITRQPSSTSNNVTISGYGYARAKEMNGMLPKQLNECCLVAMVNTHDPRPWKEQAIIDIRPDDVLTIRNLRVTNAPFPQYRDNHISTEAGRQQVKENGVLVARYAYIEYHQDDHHKPREWAFVRVGEEEADENFRIPSRVLVNDWRGGKVKGGSSVPGHSHSRQIHDLDAPTIMASEPTSVPFEQKYTAGDAFSGAGGSCRGITDANLHLEFCVDNWKHAVASLKANFHRQGTTIYDIDMHDFIIDNDIRHRVDILHLSPPCQVWSPAHTRPGQNDERNLAILFSCTHLIKKIRPRLFTIEQTFGILHPRFKNFFHNLVQGFTDHGYSVRWKVVNFSHYGLPQPRRRLIMTGAGPGENLPPFPAPTHSQRAEGLAPLRTAREALSELSGRRHHTLHQPYLQPFPTPKIPWDGDKPLPHTVTCGAAENYHWSGLRQFTPQEYALLQGFPLHHKFAGNSVKKQIGNAFPPLFVKLLYQHLTKCLDEHDKVIRQPPRDIPRMDDNIIFRTPTAQRQENIEPKGEDDDEVTFISSRKRRALLSETIDLVNDNDGDNKYIRKRARLNVSPIQAKQKTIIDLDEDMTALELDQDDDDDARDETRSDTATLRGQSPTDSPPPSLSTPFSRHQPCRLGQPPLTRSGSSASSSQPRIRNIYNSSNGQRAVRRRLFFTVPPPRAQPFSSPSSASSSTTTTSSSSSSGSNSGPGSGQSPSSNGSKGPSQVKKENENQRGGRNSGTKEEPMEVLSD